MIADFDLSRLTALLQLASPALPIGGFSYSQGLEAAIEHRLVVDEMTAGRWIGENLMHSLAACELPIWAMQYRHWRSGDLESVHEWNEWFLASRETSELRLETEQMGWSLAQLARRLDWGGEDMRRSLEEVLPVALPTVHSWAVAAHDIPVEPALTAYCFAWAENQVAAAIKAVPLGQVAGQRILGVLRPRIGEAVIEAIERAGKGDCAQSGMEDDSAGGIPNNAAGKRGPRLSTFSPQLAILSSRHENQYSRLFRS